MSKLSDLWKKDDYEGNLGKKWGFGKKLGKETKFDEEWTEYEKTGIWKGYEEYVIPLLDATYIEQMANAFASKYNVKVQSGKVWCIDIKNRVLTYDPNDLLQGTKGCLIACLLHEIGHLRHSIEPKLLKSPFLDKYKTGAFEIVNLFEDFRIDEIMKKSYEGAENVFEEQKPVIKEIAEAYTKRSEKIMKYILDRINEHPQSPLEQLKLRKLKKKLESKDTLFDFMSIILLKRYGEEVEIPKGKMAKRIKKTEPVIKKAIMSKTNQDVLTMLDKKVFPVIEDLLKETKQGCKELISLVGENNAEALMREALNNMGLSEKGENTISRISQRGGTEQIPKQWLQGKYDPLKKSVERPIKELIKKLTFLKRKELATKWQTEKTRGKLNVKSIYKFPTYNPRLFKKKGDTTDTISSFSFSFLIDTSGSMEGEPMLQTVRGLIILVEVFKKLKIPFEIISFEEHADIKKEFDDLLDKKIKQRIANMSLRRGGGTLLKTALKKMTLENRKEQNRILIILSDGCDNKPVEEYIARFNKLEKQRIKTIGIGLCNSRIADYCKKATQVLNVEDLPEAFTKILKELLLKGRKQV